jgi:hypothetical protein
MARYQTQIPYGNDNKKDKTVHAKSSFALSGK